MSGPKTRKTSRRRTLQIAVSPQEEVYVRLAAEKCGKSVSSWLHERFFKSTAPHALDVRELDSFAEAFYDAAQEELDGFDDRDGGNNPRPWGCPWTWDATGQYGWMPIADESIKDAGRRWWHLNRKEILRLVAEEEADV